MRRADIACDSGVSLVNLGPSRARSCLALLTCSPPSTGRDLSQGILSDFAEKPQVLRLRLAPRTRQTPLRMTTLVGISTEPSCLIYALSASAKDLRPALIAGLIRGVSGFGLFMRQLLEFVTKTIHQIPDFSATQTTARFNKSVEGREESALVPNWSFQAAKTVTETAFFSYRL